MDPTPSTTDSLREIIHDLNGELFLIRGFAEILRSKAAPDTPDAKHLARILESTDAIEALTVRLRARQDILEPDSDN